MHDAQSTTRVFISYSRKDLDAAQRLRDHLIDAGLQAYLDIHDIVKGEPWRERLRRLIEQADTMIFLISPDSVASEICEWEVNEAELREKRLFPVVARATPTAAIPQRLQRLNFTFLDSEDKWHSEGPSLLAALHEDIEWVREHTRLGELALRWDRAGRPARQLLRGSDLNAAEHWRDHRPLTAPALTSLHSTYLQQSRAGSQQRLRRWLAGAAVLTVFAVGLSTFAYWQRDRALTNEAIAERRAAALATDVALSRAEQGSANAALLMLLDASTRYVQDEVPEKLLLGLRDVTRKAEAARTFWFSSRSRAFHLPNMIAVFDPGDSRVHLLDPISGEQRTAGRFAGKALAATMSAGQLVFIGDDRVLYRFTMQSQQPDQAPQRLASLAPEADQTGFDWAPPTLQLGDDGELWGKLVAGHTGSDKVITQLWRYRGGNDGLQRIDIPNDLGSAIHLDAGTAIFWDERGQSMQGLALATGKRSTINPGRAAALGLAPCVQSEGKPPQAHIRAMFAALKPGLEKVRCAGVYGKLALMRQTRALARSTMEEYFFFPSGATVDAARKDYRLQAVVERLGSAGDEDPFTWFAGSASAGLIAVSHADRILVLGLSDGRYLTSSIYPGGDFVAREIATPDRTDGGRLHAGSHLSYSGSDNDRYRVSIVRLGKHRDSASVVEHKPRRAYWGSCGAQNSILGDNEQIDEKPFAVERQRVGLWTILLRGSPVTVAANDLQCASASERSGRLAVVDANGVSLYDLDARANPENGALPAIARIDDATIKAVSFLGSDHTILLTTHRFKVTAWRATGDGSYTPQTVFRGKDPLMFAEGAPTGQRMLIWQGLGSADAIVRMVAVPAEPGDWLLDGPHMLVGQPDIFFGPQGEVYRIADGYKSRLMPPVTLADLTRDALAALSPGCRPQADGDYRSSACWPAGL